ncbi:MAG: hypothetical protein AAGD10_00695 [Myxococcota bacterium]
MKPDLPLVVTGAGLSGCIGRWFADAWPGRARFVGPALFLDRDPDREKQQLLVLSQSLSPHARLAIRSGPGYAHCVVCGSTDPRPILAEAEWIQTRATREGGLRIEGPLAQIEALQALLSNADEGAAAESGSARPPVALLHDGRPWARLFAELTAWTLLELLGAGAARSFEALNFAHGGLQALPRDRQGELWLFGRFAAPLREILNEAVSPHRLRMVGLGADAWRTIVRPMQVWPQRAPFAPDGPLYGLEGPIEVA